MKTLKRNRYNRLGERQGYWEEYWDNWDIRSRGYYSGGEREGYYGYYDENGNI